MNDRSDRSRPPHVGRLIFGIVFVVIGIFGIVDADFSTTWVWASVFAAGGVVGLVTTVRSLSTET